MLNTVKTPTTAFDEMLLCATLIELAVSAVSQISGDDALSSTISDDHEGSRMIASVEILTQLKGA